MSGAKSLDIGRSLVAPALNAWGTPEQKARYLPGIETRSEQWCQLFSEPGAGSDLASLATRAELRGATWHVTGQKLWSTLAHVADLGILLARTDPSLPKHAGLTCFVLDMHQPGVTVRPLRQMTGRTDEFNEVFFDDARIADADRIGPEGAGWKVAHTVLTSERGMLAGEPRIGGGRLTRRLVDTAWATGAWCDQRVRQEIMRLYAEERALEFTNVRVAVERRAGRAPAAASGAKLARSVLTRRIEDLATRLHGAGATAWEAPTDAGAVAVDDLLQAQCATIVGGTSDIQRTIIGERTLGLPREPGPDRDAPWNQTRR